jgi:hypothetical protein
MKVSIPLLIVAGCFIFFTAIFFVVMKKFKGSNSLILNLMIIAFTFCLNVMLRLIEPDLLIFVLLASFSLFLFVFLFSGKKRNERVTGVRKEAPFKDYSRAVFDNGFVIDNVFAGVYVGGAAGSAKTRGVLIPLMRHFARYNFAGIHYAYKNYELPEYGFPIYGTENCDIVSPNDPQRTVKVNPLQPEYFQDETEILSFYGEMLQNNTKGKKTDAVAQYFNKGAVGLAAGITRVLQKSCPRCCSLPHVTALCLMNDFDTLVKMLRTDQRAEMQASNYINASGDTLSSMQGTISNFFTSFATPSIFFSLYDADGKYADLKVNRRDKIRQLYLVNDISNESVILPVINSLLYLSMKLLTSGETWRSSTLIDEGSTINLEGFSRKPATLRSFENANIFAIQDLSLAEESSNATTPRAIISNLSAQFYGKINDPKTGQLYESIFEYIEKQQKSRTTSGDAFTGGKSSVTTSKKEQKKYRSSDFFSLKTGEFVCYCNGKSKKLPFEYRKGIEQKSIEPVRTVTRAQLDTNYESILSWAKAFPYTMI